MCFEAVKLLWTDVHVWIETLRKEDEYKLWLYSREYTAIFSKLKRS